MIHWEDIANGFRLRCLIDQIIEENKISQSNEKNVMFIVGQVMRKTKGTENPIIVIDLVKERLKK